jgi:hypothetical protein
VERLEEIMLSVIRFGKPPQIRGQVGGDGLMTTDWTQFYAVVAMTVKRRQWSPKDERELGFSALRRVVVLASR